MILGAKYYRCTKFVLIILLSYSSAKFILVNNGNEWDLSHSCPLQSSYSYPTPYPYIKQKIGIYILLYTNIGLYICQCSY